MDGIKITTSSKQQITQKILNQDDLECLNENIDSDEEIFKAVVEDQNEYLNKFQKDKFAELQESVPEVDNMIIKPGWGEWTGIGVPLSDR